MSAPTNTIFLFRAASIGEDHPPVLTIKAHEQISEDHSLNSAMALHNEAEGFSLDDDENCRRVCEYLIRLTRGASLSRVVCNATVMLDPCNKCVDPQADTIKYHPDTVDGTAARKAIPLSDWHEDIGAALWWRVPVEEPPYCGSPVCDDWPGYHTHWTPILVPHEPEPAVAVVDDAL